MNRREVIQSMGLVSTHIMLPSILSGFLMRCSQPKGETYSPLFFDPDEYKLMKEVIDIIVPATSTQSASQVKVQDFLDEVFAKCLNSDQQSLIREGISKLIPDFSSANDKEVFLTEIDRKAYENDETYAFFRTIKQYTLIGFFTSREGETKASKYIKIPGDYVGEISSDETTLNYGDTTLRYYL